MLACGTEEGIIRVYDTRAETVIKIIKASLKSIKSILLLQSTAAADSYDMLIGSADDDDLVAYSKHNNSNDVFSTLSKLRVNRMASSLGFVEAKAPRVGPCNSEAIYTVDELH